MTKHIEVPVFPTLDEVYQYAKDHKLVILSRKSPADSAHSFQRLHHPHLLSFQEIWLTYKAGAYARVEDETIKSHIKKFCERAYELATTATTPPQYSAVPFNPKSHDVNEIYFMLQKEVHKPSDTMSPPCWLDKRAGPDPLDLISMANGILNTRTLELLPMTPKFFTLNALPVAYDKDAPPPTRWLQFLNEVFAGDAELIALFQERTGHIIGGDTEKLQKVFLMIGPPRGGKGTAMNITECLVGEAYTGNVSISGMATQFGQQQLIGKRYEKVTDMDTSDKKTLSAAGNFINRVSGFDTITIPRKFKDDWVGKLRCVIEKATNQIPDYGTNTPAMLARIIVLPFPISFLGREQDDLLAVLKTELPGILNWALIGLARLRENKKFSVCEASLEAKRTLVYKSNAIGGFVAEWCDVGDGFICDKDLLYDAYCEFAERVDAVADDLAPFCKKLIEQFPVKPRRASYSGTREQEFKGIRLKPAIIVRLHKHDLEMVALMGRPDLDTLLTDANGCYIRDFKATEARNDFGAGGGTDDAPGVVPTDDIDARLGLLN